jgi:hypothetical protein
MKKLNDITGYRPLARYRNWILALMASAAMSLSAATFDVTEDSLAAFRATFKGTDIDPSTVGGGNDFMTVTFGFWTVLVNLRGDELAADGSETGFYEIQLTHRGSTFPNSLASTMSTSLHYTGLDSGELLSDHEVNSQPDGKGHDYLTTDVTISFNSVSGTVKFTGTIAGDSDLNGDGTNDSGKGDEAAQTLNWLKDQGIITGQEKGQIMKATYKKQ